MNTPIPEVVNSLVCINQSSNYFCNVCEILCSGYAPYQQHIQGKNHLKKVCLKQAYHGMTMQNNPTISQSEINAGVLPNNFLEPASNRSLIQNNPTAIKPNFGDDNKQINEDVPQIPLQPSVVENKIYYCKTCQVPCSGSIQLDQHNLGKSHKKQLTRLQAEQQYNMGKASQHSTISDGSENLIPASSPENFIPAIANTTLINETALNQTSVVDGAPKTAVVIYKLLDIEKQGYASNYFCQICNIPCTGHFPYEQHLKGDKHRKKKNVYCAKLPNGINFASCQSSISDKVGIKTEEGDSENSVDSKKVQNINPIALQLSISNDSMHKLAEDIHGHARKRSCTSVLDYKSHLEGEKHKKVKLFRSPSFNDYSENSDVSMPDVYISEPSISDIPSTNEEHGGGPFHPCLDSKADKDSICKTQNMQAKTGDFISVPNLESDLGNDGKNLGIISNNNNALHSTLQNQDSSLLWPAPAIQNLDDFEKCGITVISPNETVSFE